MHRYQRVSCCQLNGFLNRERWHHTDFEAAKKNPEKLADMTGRWITEHDPEQYVYNNWKRCVDSLVTGQEFVNTNIPPGYKYYPWTIDEMMNGKNVELIEGDWS